MSTEAGALYVADADRYVPTGLTQGPWSPNHQFGGAPSALLAHVADGLPSPAPMRVARLTIDLLRPVPIAPLRVEHAVVRDGKRIQVVAMALVAGDVEVVRASVLRMRIVDLGDFDLPTGATFPGPPEVPVRPYRGPQRTSTEPGMRGAAEFAYARPDGMFDDPTWIRLRVSIVAGRPSSGIERMAYAADAVSGLGHPRGLPLTGINADIGLSVVRYAEGEWLCLTGGGWTGPDGIGVAQATMSDRQGVVGTVALSRLVDPAADDPWKTPAPG
jgi:hypothetical protein